MTTTAPAPAAESEDFEAGKDPRRWKALAVIAIAQLMVVLDASIVNIALPDAAKDLKISSLSDAQWVVTAYTLAFGGLLLLGGRIADFNGRKRAFIIGLLGFAGASALGGAATSAAMLYAARAIQGGFAAVLAPAALSLISVTFTAPKERATAFGVYGGISGGGAAIGLLLGGVLTEATWRLCLYVNVPIALLTALAAVRLVRESSLTGDRRYDVPGAVLVAAGLMAVVYGTTQASKAGVGWASGEVIGLLVAAGVLLIAFVLRERATANPLLPLRIPGDRNRGGSYLAGLLVGSGIFAMFLFLTYYYQRQLGYSPVRAGFAYLPFSLGIIVAAGVAGKIMPQVGPKALLMGGFALASVGMFTLTSIGLHTSWTTHVLPSELLISLGMGSAFVPMSSTALIGVKPHDAGVASALLNTSQQIGGAIGTAVLSTIFASAVTGWVRDHPALIRTRDGGSLASISGYHTAFTIGGALLAAAFVAVYFLISAHKEDLPAEPGMAAV